jgi:nitroreductase
MEVYDAIRTRKSVRAFLPRPVPDDLLRRVLEAARGAPSARNTQEWRFVAVRESGTRERLALEAARQPFIGTAPVLLACCAETDGRIMRCGQPSYPIDVAIAMDHLALAATAEGLGTCWIGSFDETLVKEILGIPPAVRVVQLMPLGYPADPSAVGKSRLGLDTLLHYERW